MFYLEINFMFHGCRLKYSETIPPEENTEMREIFNLPRQQSVDWLSAILNRA